MPIPAPISYPLPTELPANTVDWAVRPDRAMLLIHDMQEYFLQPYVRDAAPLPEVVANIARLRAACDAAGVPVVYTAQPGDQDPHERALGIDFWGPGLRDDEAVTRIHPDLAPAAGDAVLTKWRYSAFARTDLRERMRRAGRDQLVVTGVYAHIGCLTTAMHAFMEDVQPFLVADAVADFSAADHAMALSYVAGRCGSVVTTDAAVDAVGSGDWDDWLRGAIAGLLGEPRLRVEPDDDLFLLGLDSIRTMALLDSLSERGVAVEFDEVTDALTLRRLTELISAAGPAR